MFKGNNKNTDVLLLFLLLTLSIFHSFSSASIVDVEQVNVKPLINFAYWSIVAIGWCFVAVVYPEALNFIFNISSTTKRIK